jgi:hypothetical protein
VYIQKNGSLSIAMDLEVWLSFGIFAVYIYSIMNRWNSVNLVLLGN